MNRRPSTPFPIAMNQTAPHAFGKHAPRWFIGLLIKLARTTVLGRGKARKAVMGLISKFSEEPYDVMLWGLPVRLYPSENLCERKVLLSPSRYDAQELSFLSKALARPNSVFVDIGANSGIYSFYMAAHATGPVTLHCFEPQMELVRRIEEKFALASGKTPHVDLNIYAHALGETSGTALLTHGDGDLGGGSLVGGDEAGQGEIVRVESLVDTFAHLQITHIDALKIDVEGYEDHVLKPLFEDCPSSLLPKALLLEHVSRTQWSYDCLAAAESLGYKPVFSTRTNTGLVLSN